MINVTFSFLGELSLLKLALLTSKCLEFSTKIRVFLTFYCAFLYRINNFCFKLFFFFCETNTAVIYIYFFS